MALARFLFSVLWSALWAWHKDYSVMLLRELTINPELARTRQARVDRAHNLIARFRMEGRLEEFAPIARQGAFTFVGLVQQMDAEEMEVHEQIFADRCALAFKEVGPIGWSSQVEHPLTVIDASADTSRVHRPWSLPPEIGEVVSLT